MKPLDKKYEAEAIKLANEALLAELDAKLGAINVANEELEAKFNRSVDFWNGYIRVDDMIDPDTVAAYTASLRRWSRMNPNEPLTIELNTGGGCIISGFALYDEILRLRTLGHHVTIRVRGQAASMGGVILQAADKREIGKNALLMIHRASFGAMGSAYEVEDSLDFVKKLEGRIINIFTERSGKAKKVFTDFFKQRKDLWFDSDEALKTGLVDEIV